jgi:putative acetyltransferase
MLIRRETPADADAIRAVTAAAFTRQGEDLPVEAPLVDWLRADAGWLPALSLVAAGPDGDVIGHVLCTRATVTPGAGTPGAGPGSTSGTGGPDSAGTGTAVAVLGLGPLSVRPDWQGCGVGSALVHAVLGAADALGEPLVVLLGSTGYYPRFGFRLAREYGITPAHPEWEPHFQVRTLAAYDPAMRGAFAYAGPFDRM